MISLSMYSNLAAPVAGIVAERLVFLASLGYCIILAYYIFLVLKIEPSKIKMKSSKRNVLVFVALLILIPYSVRTIVRNGDWKNHSALFLADIDHLKNSVKANDLAAASLFHDVMNDINKKKNGGSVNKRLNEVIKYYGRCVDVYPGHYKAWNNIGIIQVRFLNDYDQAAISFRNAIKADSTFVEGYNNLGYSLSMTKDLKGAIVAYEKAHILAPDSISIISSLANLYFRSGDYIKAVDYNSIIMTRRPKSDLAWLNFASFSMERGDTTKAIGYLKTAFDLNPRNGKVAEELYKYYQSQGNYAQASVYSNYRHH
jgi:tetratricopeptide (TPR) repeat protein